MKTRGLFVALMALMIICAKVQALTGNIEIDGINYSYDINSECKTAKVVGKNTNLSGDIVIPPTISVDGIECSVISIEYRAFYNCGDIYSMTIPEGVTSIGKQSFYGCSGLSKLTIPLSVTTIDTEAFYKCTSLTSVDIPEGVTSLGNYVFANCSNLASVTIPSSMTAISGGAFNSCTSLASITISEKVTSIGSNAFTSCTSLTSISIPSSVTEIGSHAFAGCTGITSVTIPNGVTEIQSAVFGHCSGLTSVNISSSAKNIGSYAFEYCTSLSSIIIPEGVTYIDVLAFDGCTELKSVVIPSTVSHIAGLAFQNCTNLTNVYCYAETAPVADESITGHVSYHIFNKSPLRNLYVPSMSIESYKSSSPWKFFANIEGLPRLFYMVDGEVYKTVNPVVGDTIVPEPAPTKEGYTFSGWSEIPETMPDYDVTVTGSFKISSYKLIYVVDGSEISTEEVEYGALISLKEEPIKEGYTFSGWSEIPETMPAHDVTVTGTFTINQYTLTLKVGENVYDTLTLDYGTAITLPDMPELSGYTFTWGEAPETMPAQDLTIVGAYNPNYYNVTYLIDGQFYSIVKVLFGSTITPPEVPERDGSTFEWIDVPATMPAHDITIEGTYIDGINNVNQNDEQTTIYTIDGKKVNRMQRGVNIIRRGNRSVKVMK